MYNLIAEVRIVHKSKMNELIELLENDYNITEMNGKTFLISEEVDPKFTDTAVWCKGRNFDISERKRILVNNDGNISDYLKYCTNCYHEQPRIDGQYTEPHICPFCNSIIE